VSTRPRSSSPPRTSATTYVTGIVDVTRGRAPRLLDPVPGRSGKVYADWLAERETAWREQVRFAALDPFRGYATALRIELPDAVRVLDAFHVARVRHEAPCVPSGGERPPPPGCHSSPVKLRAA
jgi:transposase